MKVLHLECQIKENFVLQKTWLKIYTYLYMPPLYIIARMNDATQNSTEMFRGLYNVSLHQGKSISKVKKKKMQILKYFLMFSRGR